MSEYLYETEKYGFRNVTKEDEDKIRTLIKSGKIMEALMGKEKEYEQLFDKIITSAHLKSSCLRVIEDKMTKEFYGYVENENDSDEIGGTIQLVEKVDLKDLLDFVKLGLSYDYTKQESGLYFNFSVQK